MAKIPITPFLHLTTINDPGMKHSLNSLSELMILGGYPLSHIFIDIVKFVLNFFSLSKTVDFFIKFLRMIQYLRFDVFLLLLTRFYKQMLSEIILFYL